MNPIDFTDLRLKQNQNTSFIRFLNWVLKNSNWKHYTSRYKCVSVCLFEIDFYRNFSWFNSVSSVKSVFRVSISEKNNLKPTEILHANSLCHYMFITIYLWNAISFIKCEFQLSSFLFLSIQPPLSQDRSCCALSSSNHYKIYENLKKTIRFISLIVLLHCHAYHKLLVSRFYFILIWSIHIPSLIKVPFISWVLHWYAILLFYYLP